MNPNPDDPDAREDRSLRRAFTDLPPRDVAAGRGLTLETIHAMNAAAETMVVVTEPGEVTLDVDGIPASVAEPTRTIAMIGRLTITADEADRLGIDTEQYPNVRIVG